MRITYLLISFTAALFIVALATFALAQSNPTIPANTLIVNKTADTNDGICDADCSLREAITAANSTVAPDTITFALPPSSTIVLSGTQLPIITWTLTIDGSTTSGLTISGNDQSRLFEIAFGAVATMTHLILSDGYSAKEGGAVINYGTFVFFHGTIKDSATFYGGAIYAIRHWSGSEDIFSTTIISNSTLINNSATNGGAIVNNGYLTVTNSTINSNAATYSGGGIWDVGEALIVNTTVSYNSSGNNGGGILEDDGMMTIINSTISHNSAGNEGGGVHLAPHRIVNTIIANSLDGNDCYIWGDPNITFSLIEDGTCGATLSGDPMLGPLQNNGGSTWTHALLPGSPAIDTGTNDECFATDQRGVIRPQDGDNNGSAICDLGAYEREDPNATPTPTATATPNHTPTATPSNAPTSTPDHTPTTTPVSTPTPTHTPIPTATPSPTPSPPPPARKLFLPIVPQSS
jgi:CSLREA domain-containing protein